VTDPSSSRILQALDADPSLPLPQRLCRAASEVVGLPGVGIALMADGRHIGTVCSTEAARRAEEAQFELGEGPCVDAHQTRRPVLVPDLREVTTWVLFCDVARQAGVLSAFAFPLEVGLCRMGTLSFYGDRSGGLNQQQHDDAMLLARFGVELLLSLPEAEQGDAFPTLLSALDIAEWEVHQATGMVAIQNDVGTEDAFAILRGHAYASGRSVRDVAADVVARRQQLDGR
jgi:hypothetical protein